MYIHICVCWWKLSFPLQYTCAYYNNLLCLPIFGITFFIWGEHNVVSLKVASVSPLGWGVIAFTCICGYYLATSGFGLQRLVSATTFLVVNNMVKIADQEIPALTVNVQPKGLRMDRYGLPKGGVPITNS